MGKKLIVLGACLVILLGLCFGAKAAAGGADDPLVSVSYLYNTILPRLESLFRQETALPLRRGNTLPVWMRYSRRKKASGKRRMGSPR